jgi:hypothetical protein
MISTSERAARSFSADIGSVAEIVNELLSLAARNQH